MQFSEEARAGRERRGMTLRSFYEEVCGFSKGFGSKFERGLTGGDEAAVDIIRDARQRCRLLEEQGGGIAVDFNSVWAIEKLRQMAAERPPRPIPQRISPRFMRIWCQARELEYPIELAAVSQLRPEVLTAKVRSAICQRWLQAHMAGTDQALAETPFSSYLERYGGNRVNALAALADVVFGSLIREVGRQKISEYIGALVLTNEFFHAKGKK